MSTTYTSNGHATEMCATLTTTMPTRIKTETTPAETVSCHVWYSLSRTSSPYPLLRIPA